MRGTIRFAALEGRQQDVVDGLAVLVEQNELSLDRIQQSAGAVPERSIYQARIALAEARIRLDSQTLVAIRHQELARAEEARELGAVPQSSVDQARQALEETLGRIRLVGTTADDEAPVQQTATSDAIKELLKEQLALSTEVRALAEEAYRAGEAGLNQVHEAQSALLAAKLELAESKEDRIEIHEEMVQEANEWARIVAELAKASETAQLDVLKAKGHYLRARIALEKAKAAK